MKLPRMGFILRWLLERHIAALEDYEGEERLMAVAKAECGSFLLIGDREARR